MSLPASRGRESLSQNPKAYFVSRETRYAFCIGVVTTKENGQAGLYVPADVELPWYGAVSSAKLRENGIF